MIITIHQVDLIQFFRNIQNIFILCLRRHLFIVMSIQGRRIKRIKVVFLCCWLFNYVLFRTSAVSWRLVITHLIEMLGSIVYTYYLFDRFCVPLFRDLNIKDLTIGSYVYLISICIMPGALIQFMSEKY